MSQKKLNFKYNPVPVSAGSSLHNTGWNWNWMTFKIEESTIHLTVVRWNKADQDGLKSIIKEHFLLPYISRYTIKIQYQDDKNFSSKILENPGTYMETGTYEIGGQIRKPYFNQRG